MYAYTSAVARTFLVTGGAGFIGSNFIRILLDSDSDAVVVNLDALTYAGVRSTVEELDGSQRHRFVHGDIRDRDLVRELMSGVDVVVHFAAESHVDRSIDGPSVFLETNVVGTGVLIHAAMEADVGTFVYVSTDEVYGSVAEGFPTEDAALAPSSPYSASKAGAELLVESYGVTYGYNSIITRCSNNYGPYQFPEKLIPRFITNLLSGQKIPVYGDGQNERDWLYVNDHCTAIQLLIDQGSPGEIYNIGADAQMPNLDLTHRILDSIGAESSSIDYVEDRLGHDRRYALDSSKVRSLGWQPQHSFDEGLEETIDWYRSRSDWWRPLLERMP